MANKSGASPHVQVPADQPNYDATTEAPLGAWVSMDPKSGMCEPGNWNNITSDWPDTGGWKQC